MTFQIQPNEQIKFLGYLWCHAGTKKFHFKRLGRPSTLCGIRLAETTSELPAEENDICRVCREMFEKRKKPRAKQLWGIL